MKFNSGFKGLNRKFIFILSLHHPKERLENIFYYFPLLNSVSKKVFLCRENTGGIFASPKLLICIVPLLTKLYSNRYEHHESNCPISFV